MSWLGRLLGRSPAPAPPPAPPPRTVVIPEDLATTLTAAGEPLEAAVTASLRDLLVLRQRAQLAAEAGERIPFWLERDTNHARHIEDELRDRMAQRKSGEEEARQSSRAEPKD
jgi:hypothetical protein